MHRFGVQLGLEALAEANEAWKQAALQHNADVEFVMARLLHEAAINMMSVEQVSKASGLSPARVRALMRGAGLDPKRGKRLLAHAAAEALAENAALMGIEPQEIDLMSPLAYLPMGEQMRRTILEATEEAPHE